MDFEDTAEEAKFRADVHAWLATQAKLRHAREANDEMEMREDRDSMTAAKAWRVSAPSKIPPFARFCASWKRRGT